MSNLAHAAPPVKPGRAPRPKPPRSLRWFRLTAAASPLCCGVLTLTVGALRQGYHVEQLPCAFGAGYRLTKIDADGLLRDDAPHYDCRLSPDGAHACECLGALRWHRCKHSAALLALTSRGDLPPVPATPLDDATLDAVEAMDAAAALADGY